MQLMNYEFVRLNKHRQKNKSSKVEQTARRCKKQFLCVLSLAALFTFMFIPASLAFKSGYIYEAIHEAIIRSALKQYGFQEASLKFVIEGADSQDAVSSKKFTDSPTHHFDDCLINQSIAYFKDRFSEAVKNSFNTYKHYGSAEQKMNIKNTLYTFGEGLHTIQDFYSHSNFAEMQSASNKQDQPVDWEALPAGLKTGYFYWNGYSDNESTRSRATSVKKIKEHYAAQGSNLNFHTDSQWKARESNPTFSNCMNYVLDKKYQCLHYELNKDDQNQPEGSVKLPDGRTLHAKARNLAIMETARQWLNFEKDLIEKYPQKSQLIIPALKGYDVPVIEIKPQLPAKAAEGKAIPVDCKVSLKSSRIDKQYDRHNPGKYDLILKASVYKGEAKEAEIEHEINGRSVDSSGGIGFDLPPLKGPGERLVRFKAMFAGDKRLNPLSVNRAISIGNDSLLNSKWIVQVNFGGTMGSRKYAVTVVEDSPTSFKVRVMGQREGDTPAVFNGTRKANRIKLQGWKLIKITKIVGDNGSLMNMNAGRVVDTGQRTKSPFDISATLDASEKRVQGMIIKNKKRFFGSRIK